MAREKPARNMLVGPVLYFRGQGRLGDGGKIIGTDRWRLSALFVIEGNDEPDDLTVDGVGLPVPPRHVFVWRNKHIWRFIFSVQRTDHDRQITYGFPERALTWTMTIPGLSTRLRLAYTVANGNHDEYAVTQMPLGIEGMWSQILKLHESQPYHILVQGGNQVHADNLWKDCAVLSQWWAQPAPARYSQPFTRIMADQAMDYYFDVYCAALARPGYAKAVALIPSVMMWDDHDIFDGWGSRPEIENQCQVYRGLYAVARRQFSLFQLGAAIRDPLECVWGSGIGTFTQGFRVGDIGILMLDLRSGRTRSTVLGEASWKELPGWLGKFAGCKHLLLSSTVPLAFVGMGWLEKLVNAVSPGSHREADLRDRWRSPAHSEELLRLLRLLADFSLRYRCRITILSGNVHIGGAAIIRGCGAEMHQLFSSGVVHPPLSAINTWLLRRMVRSPERVSDDLTLEMPCFAETHQRFIRTRDFISLGFDRQNHLIARWHSEGNPDHYNLVI
ncbi:MAG: alkaline phosphatase family protein [Rhodospirillaceae bacterium]